MTDTSWRYTVDGRHLMEVDDRHLMEVYDG